MSADCLGKCIPSTANVRYTVRFSLTSLSHTRFSAVYAGFSCTNCCRPCSPVWLPANWGRRATPSTLKCGTWPHASLWAFGSGEYDRMRHVSCCLRWVPANIPYARAMFYLMDLSQRARRMLPNFDCMLPCVPVRVLARGVLFPMNKVRGEVRIPHPAHRVRVHSSGGGEE